MPSLTTYKLLKQEHDARRGEFKSAQSIRNNQPNLYDLLNL